MNALSKNVWIQQEDVPGADETATSAYYGLKKIKGSGNTIISYSDIILFDKELLEKLKHDRRGDIIIAVDTEWRNNYPKERIWHDKSHAELVFGTEDKIERIGEIRNRYKTQDGVIPKSFEPKFKPALIDCIGEIVGLFKFSKKARKVFYEEFEKFAPNGEFDITAWPSVNGYTSLDKIARNKALLGCFLEYLILHSKKKLSAKMLKVQGGWAEIDHLGDLYSAKKKVSDAQSKA